MAGEGLNLKKSQNQYAFEKNSVPGHSLYTHTHTEYRDGKSDNIYMLCFR